MGTVARRAGAGRARRARRALALAGVLAAGGMAATPSPTGAVVAGPAGKIAFESNRDGNPEIYVMNGDGTVETNVTNHPGWDFYPVWSPDATEIAWGSDRGEQFNVDVHVMAADGTDVRRLTTTPGEDRGASWSSDGSKIAFHSARHRGVSAHAFDLMVMNADGTDQKVLDQNGSAGYVCATPGVANTDKVVFNSNRTGAFEIYTIPIDGSAPATQVTNFGDFNSGPKWSPDCSSIAFNRFDAGGSLDVFRIDADGDPTSLVNLTNAPGVFDAFAAWSPEGDRILFSSNRDVNFEIYTMDADDGADVVRYTHTGKGEADLRGDWGTAPNTYGPPTDKDQCRKGRWMEFRTPTFNDQSECVSYVASGSIVNDA
ncbi:MAG TPA: hypothetical protein VM263_08660 [Acidimicrobiales bacterium]|nr:hypothetical protein [Acidimicrobiales bacterium]